MARKGKISRLQVNIFVSRTKQSLIHFPTEEIKKKHEQKEAKKAAKGPQWRSEGTNKKKKVNYRFTTVDELKQSGGYGGYESEDEPMEEIKPTTKIIDMTGKTQREIKDMRQIPSQLKKQKSDDSDSDSDSSSSEEEYDKLWDVKELKFNLEKLVNMSRDEILKNERDRKTAEDQKYNYRSGSNYRTIFFAESFEFGTL